MAMNNFILIFVYYTFQLFICFYISRFNWKSLKWYIKMFIAIFYIFFTITCYMYFISLFFKPFYIWYNTFFKIITSSILFSYLVLLHILQVLLYPLQQLLQYLLYNYYKYLYYFLQLPLNLYV